MMDRIATKAFTLYVILFVGMQSGEHWESSY